MKIILKYSCLLVFHLSMIPSMNGQEDYFSKVIRGYNGRTAFWDMTRLVESGDILTTTTRNETDVYTNSGWLRVSPSGELLDSFFFERNSLVPLTLHPMAVKGDTVFQLLRFINDTDLVQVHGSSLSNKDSLLCWTYDFSHLPNFRRVDSKSCMINAAGNLVITGTYSIQRSPTNATHLFFMEVDMEGTVLVNTSVMEVNNTPRVDYYSRVIEIGEYYYTCISIDNSGYKPFIIKIDKKGSLQWISEEDSEAGGSGGVSYWCKAELSYSDDRHEFYLVYNNFKTLEDFPGMDPEEEGFEELWLSFSFQKTKVIVFDMHTGERLRDYRLLAPANSVDNIFSNQISKVNGDLIIIGKIQMEVPPSSSQQNAGLFIRMDPVTGEFKHKYKVLDKFGHPYVYGNHFTDLAEDEEGNVYLAGQVNNFVFGTKQATGWMVKLGIDPCEDMHCMGDTLSGHTHITSVHDYIITKTHYLKLSPNPVEAGGTVRMSFDDGKFPIDISRIRILNNSGQVVQEISTANYTEAGRLQLPQVSPGIYYIEMVKKLERERYVGKVVVY